MKWTRRAAFTALGAAIALTVVFSVTTLFDATEHEGVPSPAGTASYGS
jgi:hypothetical protein